MSFSKCAGCGSLCDGDVCDTACEARAYDQLLEARLKAGTWALCSTCEEPTLIGDIDPVTGKCEGCRDRANEAEAGSVANG